MSQIATSLERKQTHLQFSFVDVNIFSHIFIYIHIHMHVDFFQKINFVINLNFFTQNWISFVNLFFKIEFNEKGKLIQSILSFSSEINVTRKKTRHILRQAYINEWPETTVEILKFQN